MTFNYNRLRGRIVEKFGTQAEFAKAMDWSERTLSLHLNNIIVWRQPDIVKAIELLGLSCDDIGSYFYALNVQSIEQSEVII